MLASALVTGAAGLAMAQGVPINSTSEAPDTVYNPNAHLAYGVPEQSSANNHGGFTYGGYRGNFMLGGYGQPQATSTPYDVQGGLQSEYEY